MSAATRPRPATSAARATARAAAAARRPRLSTRATAAADARGAPAARAAVPAPLRLAHVARGLPDSAFIDRLLAGRVWVAVVATALIGIVFMQVSLLRLNAGIGAAVDRQAALERENAALRADVSGLSAGPRIQEVATGLGMVMAPAGDVRYLDVTGGHVTLLSDRAAHVIAAPSSEAIATVQEGRRPETRAAVAVSADAPPGTTPATGAPVEEGALPAGGAPVEGPAPGAAPPAVGDPVESPPASPAAAQSPVP